jgi:hypothetical protein
MITDVEKFHEPINLGSAEGVTINQLVDIAEEIGGVKLKRNYNLDAPKGVNGRNSDNTLIKQVFNWEPDTKLRDGLEKTYKWIYDQVASARPSTPDRQPPALNSLRERRAATAARRSVFPQTSRSRQTYLSHPANFTRRRDLRRLFIDTTRPAVNFPAEAL